MIKRLSILFSLLLVISFSSIAQLSDKEKFMEAMYLMDENRFSSAMPYLLEIYKKDKDNANINYNLGLAYLNSFNEKEKENALPFLKIATENASPKYNPFDPREKKAPVDAFFYLAKAQHNDYQFIEARTSLLKFKTYINDKHYLWSDVDKNLKMADYAQKAILNPVNIIITNLGDLLNGYYPDFSPVVRIDETAIYFTSRRLREDSSNLDIYDPQDGMYYEDLYVSFKNEESGIWESPMALNINTEGHEATVNLSIDGQTLYIYKDIRGNGELFESKLISDSAGYETWSEPKKLGSDINSKSYETHVTITPNGKRLYYISDREGGLGGKDIYYCNLLPTGTWALSQNAGPILNSEFDEDGVFMHPDGKTLYFSSNGHESMGGYDIMFSTNTDSGWTSPKNLGYPINSVDDDVFFVTTPDGKRAYFSSFKEEGYGEKDVYMLELLDATESAITLYRGEFTFIDRYTPPSGALVSITNNNTGELVGYYTPRQRDGQFTAILETNTSYHFTYEADAYETYEEDIYVPLSANYQEIYKDIKLRPVRVGDGMDTIPKKDLADASVKGAIMNGDIPMQGIKILLMEEDKDLIEQTETDDLGTFQFSQLHPYNTYLIEVISDTGNPILGYEIDIENDQGEILTFDKIDENTYIFIPSSQPYEFYGISAKSIAGTVKKNGDPLAGLNVILENEEKELIQQEETDEYGEFNFQKLDPDNKYRIVFEGDFPDDPEIILTNDFGEELAFRKVKEGVYEYVPVGTPMIQLEDILGAVTVDKVPVKGLALMLEDKERNILSKTTTDSLGKFNFMDLDLLKPYYIEFEGDFPPDIKLVVSNDDFDLMLFRKIEAGLYKYDPSYKVRLVDNSDDILERTETDQIADFNYNKLNADESYKIIYEGDFPDESFIEITNDDGIVLRFNKINEGIYEYVPDDQLYTGKIIGKNGPLPDTYVRVEDERRNLISRFRTDNIGEFRFKKLDLDKEFWVVFEEEIIDDIEIIVSTDFEKQIALIKHSNYEYQYVPPVTAKSYTMDTDDRPDLKETLPRPAELRNVIAYFQRYFIYNAKDINRQNKDFVAFVNDIAELVKLRGNAELIITSSASKVPTRTWKTNSILTKKRAYDTKALLEQIFKEKGIKPEQYNFVDINTLITGPEYKGDYATNKREYEKYQYVRIFVK